MLQFDTGILSPLVREADTFRAFSAWKAKVELETGGRVKIVRDDKGGEYESRAFCQLYAEAGIFRHLTAPATPQQNGVAERFSRTAEERDVAMFQDAHLTERFWGEALAAYRCGPQSMPNRSCCGQDALRSSLQAETDLCASPRIRLQSVRS